MGAHRDPSELSRGAESREILSNGRNSGNWALGFIQPGKQAALLEGAWKSPSSHRAQCLGSSIPSSAARMLETQVLGAEIKSPVVPSMQEGSGIPGVLGLLQRRSQRAPCSWNRALCERSQAGFWLGKKMIRFVRIATEHWRKSHEK